MNPHGVELFCPECGAQVAPGRSAEPCAACGYGSDSCTHDPKATWTNRNVPLPIMRRDGAC
jgi:ribosomal protein L37E